MMKNECRHKKFKNNRGFATADFLFSFMLAAMLTTLLFAMCFTFTVIEIAQYISFSATRAGVAAHKSPSHQRQRIDSKLNRLLADPVLSPLFRNGWFELTLKDVRIGQNPSDYYDSDYGSPKISSTEFYLPSAGARLSLVAKILNLNLGPLGRIQSESGNDFSLTIGSMIFREPSQSECTELMQSRYQSLISLDATYGSMIGQRIQDYVPMEDNGC